MNLTVSKVYEKQFAFESPSKRKFKDFSRTYIQIQGLFKEKWNSRTLQGLPLKFKDFLRLCEPCTLMFINFTQFVILENLSIFDLALSGLKGLIKYITYKDHEGK